MTGKVKYIGAIDQGTTSTRFVIFNKKGEIISISQTEHSQIYPKAGWVEHDPLQIRDNTFKVIKDALKKSKIKADQLSAIGITNQRETTVIWNPRTGQPYCNAIVWQDTRTDKICKKISVGGNIDSYRDITGLPLATYFSGPKIKWILDNVPGVKEACNKNEVYFGTMDSWLVWWLTGGPGGGVHITDVSNASRTLLMNLKTLNWDNKMLKVLDIPENILPEIKPSSCIYGYTKTNSIPGIEIPISGVLGDQQAALFGQACLNEGDAKNTYGTGSFMLLNIGNKIVHSKFGLITTLAYQIENEKPVYALEGSVAIAGSLVQWYRDNLGLIKNSSDIEKLAESVNDNGGVYFVPAFSGLFAPYWRSDARGMIIGLTHYINKGHIARAILESSAFQISDIYEAMKKDAGINFNSLKVDGGMVVNELLMQFQSNLLDLPVIKPKLIETTVLGAAYAAGLAVGYWSSKKDLINNWKEEKRWTVNMDSMKRDELLRNWQKAVQRTFNWLDE